ncbi:MAG: acetyl-CoA acetyltransferase [Alphaproteobacteria bacterium]|nr:acetyl-CoA acetyltransferase [Alphaproteobacteria bacterium]
MDEARIPILIGAGQLTQRTAQKGKLEESLDPMQLLVDAANKAAADTGVADKIAAALDTIAVVRFTADSSEAGRLPVGQYKNAPRSLGNRIGAKAKREYYTAAGGNTPQWLVNRIADEIARGEVSMALLAGSEDLATMIGALNKGIKLEWGEDPGGEPIHIGEHKAGVNDLERRHALYFPVNAYPLFENGIRGHKGRNVRDHQLALGRLFAPFSKVAASNPYAWFPKARTPEEIATPAEDNRYVGFPYTKYMNAIIQVDMAAAVIMTNVKTARELGVHANKWVYLHGGADASDIWNVSERINYYSSPAIRTIGQKALGQADRTINDIDFFDIYSCFPSAVQIACAELGIAEDDPRGLTVTGGLPYFGGAGNNYVMHSIVTMMEKVRGKPGSFGLVTANGWYVTKHAMGIYSTLPPRNPWERENPKSYQTTIDAMAHPAVDPAPNGQGTVETYTVMHDRGGPKMGIIIGRLENGHRFVAHTPNDPQTLNGMMSREMLGTPGKVTAGEKTNLFIAA